MRLIILMLSIILLSGCSSYPSPFAPPTVDNAIFIDPSEKELISSYDNYLSYISENKSILPHDFVAYESISFLGEFRSWLFVRNYSSKYYCYTIHETNGILIELIHRYTQDIDSHKDSLAIPEKSSENMTEFTRHPSGHACYVTIYGIQYHYDLDGNLTQLTWFNNNQWDMTFSFPENFSLDNCQETILSQLLNADTAQAAAEKLLSIGAKN